MVQPRVPPDPREVRIYEEVLIALLPTWPPYECCTTTTSNPFVVSATIGFRTAWTSSPKVAEGSDIVDGRATLIHLYCCFSRSDVTLSHTLAMCHAPGTKTSVGLRDMLKML
jgi:hypothetical protein